MSYVSVLSSEHYASFLIGTEEDGTLGCHIPRTDAVFFAQEIKMLLENEDNFPEFSMETDTMIIEGMSAGDSVMFACQNKLNQKRIQFALDRDDCEKLMQRLEGSQNTSSQTYGPPKNKENELWRFFSGVKKEAV